MRGTILVLLGSICYGILATFVKFAYKDGFSVGEVVGSQMLFGALLLWLTVWVRQTFKNGKAVKQSNKASILQVIKLLLAGLTIGCTSFFYSSCLSTTPASLAILLLFQFTWIGIVIEALITRRRPTRDKWVAVIVLLIGTVLAGGLFEVKGLQVTAQGIGYGLLSALSYSLFLLVSGKVATQVDGFVRTAWMTTGAMIFIFIILPPQFLINGALFDGLIKYALLLAFFGMLCSTSLMAMGVPLIGGGLASILGAAELPTAVFMSSFFLNEPTSWLKWLGVIVILIGIAIPEIWRVKQALTKRVH